jgi:hypothetical protein
MKREVLTYPLSEQQMREELAHVVEFYLAKSATTCRVLFGYAWGNDYYLTKEWLEEEVALNNLIAKVAKVEATGVGRIGSDDLFLQVDDLEFLFCHDSDIHISFIEHHPEMEHFYQRWKMLGFKPAEWLKDEPHGSSKKVRDA